LAAEEEQPIAKQDTKKSEGAKVEAVELVGGQKYTLEISGDGNGKITFDAEAGGMIGCAEANGTVQGGKLLLTAFGREFEGNFTSASQATVNYKGIEKPEDTGSAVATLTKC